MEIPQTPPAAPGPAPAEVDELAGLLRATEGNISTASRMAGRNRTEFYNLLNRHGLEPESFRRRGD